MWEKEQLVLFPAYWGRASAKTPAPMGHSLELQLWERGGLSDMRTDIRTNYEQRKLKFMLDFRDTMWYNDPVS